MKISLLVVFLLLPCSLFAESFDVVDHEMKLGLIELQEEIDFISSAVMGCIDSGREQHDCMCANKAMFSIFLTLLPPYWKNFQSWKILIWLLTRTRRACR